ncbi:hypothetical protein RFI_38553, partial [Reticulomyxa filosa]
ENIIKKIMTTKISNSLFYKNNRFFIFQKKKGLSSILQKKDSSKMSTKVNNCQPLPDLPKPFTKAQCILFKEELLICGGANTNRCYSYHTLKRQYKYICSYPSDVQFNEHCVVQLNNPQTDPNEIDLLSFGGQNKDIMKQTFSMKYKS